MLLIARTDAESAKLLSSSVDRADHEHILGTTDPECKPMADVLAEAEATGASGAVIDKLETEWTEKYKLYTYGQGNIIPVLIM